MRNPNFGWIQPGSLVDSWVGGVGWRRGTQILGGSNHVRWSVPTCPPKNAQGWISFHPVHPKMPKDGSPSILSSTQERPMDGSPSILSSTQERPKDGSPSILPTQKCPWMDLLPSCPPKNAQGWISFHPVLHPKMPMDGSPSILPTQKCPRMDLLPSCPPKNALPSFLPPKRHPLLDIPPPHTTPSPTLPPQIPPPSTPPPPSPPIPSIPPGDLVVPQPDTLHRMPSVGHLVARRIFLTLLLKRTGLLSLSSMKSLSFLRGL